MFSTHIEYKPFKNQEIGYGYTEELSATFSISKFVTYFLVFDLPIQAHAYPLSLVG